MKRTTAFFVISSITLGSCGTVPHSSGAMQLGPDTYRVSARASMGSKIESQKMALSEAKDYCTTLKREMVVTATEYQPYEAYEVTFRCLLAGDRDLVRPNLEKSPDTVIEIK